MVLKYKKTVGLSTSHNIERNCHFYHVCQHISIKAKHDYFAWDYIAQTRQSLFFKYCNYHGVIVVQSIVMPNHTHDIVYVNDYEDLAKAYKATNMALSKIIRAKFKDITPDERLFSSRPRYTAITSFTQFYSECLYLFGNPEGKDMEMTGFDAKNSSFCMLKNGYLPEAFDIRIYEMMKIPLPEYLELLEKPISVYLKTTKRIDSMTSQREKDLIFKINPDMPYTSLQDELEREPLGSTW